MIGRTSPLWPWNDSQSWSELPCPKGRPGARASMPRANRSPQGSGRLLPPSELVGHGRHAGDLLRHAPESAGTTVRICLTRLLIITCPCAIGGAATAVWLRVGEAARMSSPSGCGTRGHARGLRHAAGAEEQPVRRSGRRPGADSFQREGPAGGVNGRRGGRVHVSEHWYREAGIAISSGVRPGPRGDRWARRRPPVRCR